MSEIIPETEIDWVEVDPNILHSIAKKTGDLSNYVRFRAVCKKWFSAAPLNRPPPQLPWFLESVTEQQQGIPLFYLPRHLIPTKTDLDFYSLYSDKTHTLHLPEVGHKTLLGPCTRFVLVDEPPLPGRARTVSPFLLNPLTRTQLPLPFGDAQCFIPLYIGPNPASPISDDALVSLLVMRNRREGTTLIISNTLSVRKANDGSWTNVEVDFGCRGVYYNDKIVMRSDMVRAIDVTTGRLLYDVPYPIPNLFFDYLIEASGALLGVVKHFPQSFNNDSPLEGCRFDVYRLEENVGGDRSWAKLSSIGDIMMFLDTTVGFCLNARDFDGFGGNCIYFMREWRHRFVLGRFDMEEGRAEVIHREREYKGTWFVPCAY